MCGYRDLAGEGIRSHYSQLEGYAGSLQQPRSPDGQDCGHSFKKVGTFLCRDGADIPIVRVYIRHIRLEITIFNALR